MLFIQLYILEQFFVCSITFYSSVTFTFVTRRKHSIFWFFPFPFCALSSAICPFTPNFNFMLCNKTQPIQCSLRFCNRSLSTSNVLFSHSRTFSKYSHDIPLDNDEVMYFLMNFAVFSHKKETKTQNIMLTIGFCGVSCFIMLMMHTFFPQVFNIFCIFFF